MKLFKSKEDPKAKEAVIDATENLRKTKLRSYDVYATARALRLLREHNHFQEQLQAIMKGER